MALTRPKIWDLDTNIQYFMDPITVLHQGATQANVDVGFLFNRANGLVSNVAVYWSESAQSIVTAYTANTGVTNSNITPISYANLTIGNLLMVNGSILNVTGNINANTAGTHYGNVYATSYFYANGTPFVGGSGGITYTANTAPPASGNVNGSQWYNTTTDVLYEYVFDGTSSYWVDITSPTVSNSSVSTGSSGSSNSSGYTGTYVLTGTTTNATQTEIFVNGVASSRIPISANVTAYYTMDVAARRTDVAGESGAFYLKAVAANVAGTVSDVGSVYEVVVARSDTNYLVDMRSNNTSKAMTVLVTGVAGKTINWRAVVSSIEV